MVRTASALASKSQPSATPADSQQAQRFPQQPPIQQKPLIGMKLVVSYLSLMDRPLDERTVLQMQLSS
ncbi:hypothetical protein, partial [Escherichia coli]|uniref:hypothetical protein n=1 Tax=Escherichia coli TaxID=562 RepID=UPI001B30819A